jgi:uncharacterized membrane protein
MRFLLLGLGLALLCAVTPARAALTLCNRTSYVLYAATAAIKTPQSQTQGWTRVAPGECQVARKEALAAETYLVHARSSLSHSGPARAWGGGFPMCVKDTDFNLTQSGAMAVCSTEGSFALPFAALDTGGRANWTMTLDEQPALASLTAAQLAGAKRLLRDNGFDPGPIDGSTSKFTGVALMAARKKFAAEKLDNVALFVRLESEARRTNAPSGYTVCNDADAPLDVALAEVAKSKPVSRGWWTVPRGACARASTAPLAKDAAYYLFARRKDGTPVASGKEMFCIAPAAFEIAVRGDCAARKQQEAGFVRTQTGGLGGYTARIGKAGLSAASAAQVTISK